MTAYEKYKEMKKQETYYLGSDMYDEAAKITHAAVEIRNNEFTKEDWLQLIYDAPTGRARYEYTRMMNERFPESKIIFTLSPTAAAPRVFYSAIENRKGSFSPGKLRRRFPEKNDIFLSL